MIDDGFSMKNQSIWVFLAVTVHLSSIINHPSSLSAESPPPVVYLSGRPYEMGRQHGQALRDQVRASVANVLGYFRQYVRIPWIGPIAVNWWIDRVWLASSGSIPKAYLEELRGLADGSGVPLTELKRLHAIPDRTYSCSNFAAWGRATAGGRLIHVRNLDWNIKAGIQDHPVVFVVRPAGKRAFVSVAWAGFIGVLTAVNDAQVSIGQVGAESTDVTFRGEPMTFVMRRVVEETDSADAAARLIAQARRTVGVNYVVADAKAGRALAIETTRRQVRVFEADDPAEREVDYARPIADAVFRADTALDPVIRERQIASRGDPHRPGLEPPGGSAYTVRYLGQAAGLHAHFGELDVARARDIAGAVAPDSNVQSVVFAWPDMWVANAKGTVPAAQTTYFPFNLEQLFKAAGAAEPQ
jgi:hypothetical protein